MEYGEELELEHELDVDYVEKAIYNSGVLFVLCFFIS